ncbi:unnamed protein product [Paramecium octaurelia]|uniref:Uncharacterized protein n=1 Tax=Paramecium octaurelia TaxID=43137 RepID=A0A8S1XM23_PAROT|nr:unnamed protein product [Paramecium octaurelia]
MLLEETRIELKLKLFDYFMFTINIKIYSHKLLRSQIYLKIIIQEQFQQMRKKNLLANQKRLLRQAQISSHVNQVKGGQINQSLWCKHGLRNFIMNLLFQLLRNGRGQN